MTRSALPIPSPGLLARALSVCLITCLTASAQQLTPSAASRAERQADDAYIAGARALDRNDLDAAEASFRKAVTLNSTNPDYSRALTIVREHRLTALVQQAGQASVRGDRTRADALLAEARALDPGNAIVTQHGQANAPSPGFVSEIDGQPVPWTASAPAIASPITLVHADGKRTFHIHADARSVLRQVFSNFDVRATFDDSVPSTPIRFDLENATYAQAVPFLLRIAGVFAVPLETNSVLLAKDTTDNRQRLERQVQETIFVPGSTPEQMTELSNLVRSVFDIRTANAQNNNGSLVLRAPADTLNALNLTLADLVDGGAQVMLDVRLYAVDKTRIRNIGVQFPQQFGVYNVASAAQDLVTSNQTLVNQAIAQGVIPANATNIQIALYLIASGLVQSSLLTNTLGFFGNGLTLTGVSLTGTTSFNLALNSSDSRVLDDVQLRLGDKQTGTFRVGTRYPITTGTYTVGSSVSSASLAGITVNGVSASSLLNQYLGSTSTTTIPQVQYEDLGVTFKATPTVQKSGRIAMHLDLKIEALSGSAEDNIPILSNRQFVSDITVGDGDTALMISSVNRTESKAINGLPGLSELPGFQAATSDRVSEVDSGELVLLVTPHVVRRRSATSVGPRIAFNQPLGSSE